MSSSLLGLPPVPPELKTIVPYLQRADELKKQDPIISYWCTYYAAQIGIHIKARDNPSRDLLFELLGVLEKMKAEIGPSDAVDVESVSAAYVENFALKVFANADNEDRSGKATRSTAKKFLAAVNFLEVLKTFPKKDISESTEEKIRYGKWKAAEIAKAFREGRKPAPGPPGWAEEQDELQRLQREREDSSRLIVPTDSQELGFLSSTSSLTNQRYSPTQTSHFGLDAYPNRTNSPLRPTASWSDLLSDAAETQGPDVPNTALPISLAREGNSSTQTTRVKDGLVTSRSGVHTIDAFSGSARGPLKKPAWTNEELEGKYSPTASPKKSSLKSGSPESDKRVRFSPTKIEAQHSGSSPKSDSPPKEYSGPDSIYAPSVLPPSQLAAFSVSQTHGIAGYSPSLPPPPSTTPGAYIYAPSPSRNSHPHILYPNAPPPIPEPFELTPEIISGARKRCRYAMSALDYEDVETARRELRAALALLEGN